MIEKEVFAIKCASYRESEAAVAELFKMMGGGGIFAAEGESLALKANLLFAAKPEAAATTHPEIVKAVAKIAVEQGAKPFIADSPGSGYRYDKKNLEKTYRCTGMLEAARDSGAELNFDCSHKIVSYPPGRRKKRFEIITPI